MASISVLLVDIFYLLQSLLTCLYIFSPSFHSLSLPFIFFLQCHCVSLYRQCIRRAVRQRLLDNILPCCVLLCVFIRLAVNVPKLGQSLSLSLVDWVLSTPPYSAAPRCCCCSCFWFLCTSLNALCWPHVNVWYMVDTVA